MKIAIPTDNGKVAQHFGRCPEYTIYDLDNEKITNKNVIDNPGHSPGFLPKFLNEKGVDCIVAGGMGHRAKALFDKNNIEVVIGARGDVDDVLNNYLQNNLDTDSNLCDHGEGHSH